MATRRDRPGPGRRAAPATCHFCDQGVVYVDFKDVALLRGYVSDRGRIRSRRATGTCGRHQGEVARAVKNAREMALLPYSGAR